MLGSLRLPSLFISLSEFLPPSHPLFALDGSEPPRQQAQGFTQGLLGMGMILILGIMGVVTWQQLDLGNILAQASTVTHPKG
ncbi:hypothetical protein [Acaryochloris marina]|uniref:hypothetical protein n=1 Tax=Acaryochloris marina TaxID=155978 RepID=UPI0021C28F2E|nr:hypothetical protein [Acaryochloris marina]